MGLRARFNLVLTTVFLAGLAVTAYISYEMLQRNARAEVLHNANLMIETARAIRSYTVDHVRPQLKDKLQSVFLPESVPAFAATETLGRLPEEYRSYIYRESTLNPTNPANRAVDWEADVIQAFKRDERLKSFTGERMTPSGPSLFIASPIRITNAACLTCHTTPAEAPPTLIKRYGSDNGFGWKLNEIIGAQIVSVPMSVAVENANRAFAIFMLSVCGIFVVLYVALNWVLSRMILRPIAEMARSAEAVSTGDFDVPEFAEGRRDEVGMLAVAFNRMRRSLQQAFKMIEP